MRGAIIFFAFLFIVLIVGITILYFVYEKPKQEEINSYSNVVNFTIYATENNENIKTGYKIVVNGNLYSVGETLTEAPVIESVPTNNSVVIYNYNKENQDYYTTVYEKNIVNSMENQRVELKLIKPGELIIHNYKNLEGNTQILINISSTSSFHKPYLCFSWSSHIITVSTIYQEVSKLERYEMWDKCYNFDREITQESFLFPIDYKVFGQLNDNDFIKMAFIDSDCPANVCLTFSKNDKNESIDTGSKDIIVELKK